MRLFPIGEVVEIFPRVTSDSSLVTSVYSIFSSFVLSKTSMIEPNATPFLISFGSSWASSCSRALISSSNFFFTCSGMDLAVPSAPERHGGDQELGRSERQFTLRTGRGVRSIDRFPSDYTPRDSANKQSDAPTFTHPKGLN